MEGLVINKMGRIKLLDCTLRDGAYVVDSKFGETSIIGLISKLEKAGIDIIECGWLKNTPHEKESSFYHLPSDIEKYIDGKKEDVTYVVMIDWDRYDLSYLPECDGKSIDAIRVVFPHDKFKEGIAVGKAIIEKGYKVFYQAANTLAYSNEDLVKLAQEANTVQATSLSIVDTFGSMYFEDLERITKILDDNLDTDVSLGLHSHNNQQLSFALTMQFVKMMENSSRDIVVDSSLCGMGRGAGNATTELLTGFLNEKYNHGYDIDEVLDAIDIYMEPYKQKYTWGYSTAYFIAGKYCCHVNNIAYLTDNHRTSAKDMRQIIESLAPEDRLKYDYDLLESKYIENRNYLVDDASAIRCLVEKLADKNVVIVAPGSMSDKKRAEILDYILENNSVVIGVNAILEGYKYDYLFFTNAARYEYASVAHKVIFGETEKILLSNIKNETKEKEIVINYNGVVKRGWPHFDNAVISCLRLMNKLHIANVSVAGFDGFSKNYNESFADKSLPSLYQIDDWDELNEEIAEMFQDVKSTSNHIKNIQFLTSSIFDR